MKKVECYQCDVCEHIFYLKEDAKTCEVAHKTFDKLNIIDAKYKYDDSEYGYPYKLLVEIEGHSGSLANYIKEEDSCMENICEKWYPEE